MGGKGDLANVVKETDLFIVFPEEPNVIKGEDLKGKYPLLAVVIKWNKGRGGKRNLKHEKDTTPLLLICR
jgi:hypothetical protein